MHPARHLGDILCPESCHKAQQPDLKLPIAVLPLALKVLVVVPTRILLEQFAPDFPNFCKVGTGYNQHIKKNACGFIAVSDSVHLLGGLCFEIIFVDEAHHPLPRGLPDARQLYLFSATHGVETDFEYGMGQGINDGVLCDYDLTVPVLTEGHVYLCLASLLLSNAGHFRRVLAYCNTVSEAKRVKRTFETLGIRAWHINAATHRKKRQEVIEEFAGSMQRQVHVLVTVQVLGEGVNIPNADTCMFVEPRNSYTSIVQAIGRVLRQHISKPLAHVVLPAVAMASANAHEQESARSGARDHSLHTSTSGDDVGTFGLYSLQSREGEPTASDTDESASAVSPCLASETSFSSASSPSKPNQIQQRNSRSPTNRSSAMRSSRTESFHLGNLVRPSPRALADTEEATSLADFTSSKPVVASAQDSLKLNRTHSFVRKKFRLPGSIKAEVEGWGSQLERFLSVIAHADGCLANAPTSLRFRLSFADCRSSPNAHLAALTQNLLQELVILLGSRDPWDARVQQLEDFVRQHDRLPTPEDMKHKSCKSLFFWVKNTGVRVKQGKIPADRQAQLLNSPLAKIRLRAAAWVNPELRFRQNCKRLKVYLARVQSVPKTARNLDPEGRSLSMWLQSQRATVLYGSHIRSNVRRCEMLAAVHPLMAEYMQSWRQPRIRKVRRESEQRWSELLRFVSQKGRLPRSIEDHRLYQYLRRLWRRFPDRSKEEQSKVLTAHPLLTSYFQTAPRTRTNIFSLLKSGAAK